MKPEFTRIKNSFSADKRKKRAARQGSASLEYMTLIVFVIGALIVFGIYITRAMVGQWKKAGDTFGFGEQYDPRPYMTNAEGGDGGVTLECFFDYTHCQPGTSGPDCPRINAWVDKKCYESFCDCTLDEKDSAYQGTGEPDPSGCLHCVIACSNRGAHCHDAP